MNPALPECGICGRISPDYSDSVMTYILVHFLYDGKLQHRYLILAVIPPSGYDAKFRSTGFQCFLEGAFDLNICFRDGKSMDINFLGLTSKIMS